MPGWGWGLTTWYYCVLCFLLILLLSQVVSQIRCGTCVHSWPLSSSLHFVYLFFFLLSKRLVDFYNCNLAVNLLYAVREFRISWIYLQVI